MACFIYDIYDLRSIYTQNIVPSFNPPVDQYRADDIFVAWLLERLQYVFLIPLSNPLAATIDILERVNPTPRYLHSSLDTWIQSMFATLNETPYRSLALSHYTLTDNDLVLELF